MSQDKTRIFRSVTAMLLALIMILSALPVLAETEPSDFTESQEEESVSTEEWSLRPVSTNYSNTAAFNTYVNNVMYSKTASAARANASSLLRGRLNKDEKNLYDALLKKIESVAAGKLASTSFTIKTFNPKFPASNSTSDLRNKVSIMIANVVSALQGDGPCEMFWYDILSGWDGTFQWKTAKGKHQITQVTINMYVAKEFSSSNSKWTTKFNKSKAKAVQAAAANAKKIVQKYRGKSDVEKLRAYKNEICRLNDYNDAAANDVSMPYGNPWQLVWVFDGDPKTNVVCEGYSKAFQYLCELSSFSGSIDCLSMGGYIWSTGGSEGPHMWNVVKMPDNKHYLVDVTWSDTGASGANGTDYLFLKGCLGVYTDGFSPTNYPSLYYDKGYVFDTGRSYAIYFFDSNKNIKIYKESDKDLNLSAFNPNSDKTKARGTCGKDAEWSLNNGVLKIGGSGKMSDYSKKSPAPWKQYAGSIKKIVIGKDITQIGNYAFNGLKAAKNVTIGEKVSKIGKYAFNGCKKLATITIKSTKLKTVGNKAFKGIPKKAKFVCPAKKLDAYKKLLLKKGVPKTATFKK